MLKFQQSCLGADIGLTGHLTIEFNFQTYNVSKPDLFIYMIGIVTNYLTAAI